MRYLLICCAFSLRVRCTDIIPDPRTCTPDVPGPGVCDPNATCTPVTPYVCSATRPRSYRCECNQGYTGDGINCTGEITLAVEML